jgi:protein TonB
LLKSDIFKWTLVVSVVFHLIVVLGISFIMPAQAERPVFGPPLKITLVTSRSETAPDLTDTLAQMNSQGENEAFTEPPGFENLNEVAAETENPSVANQADQVISTESVDGAIADNISSQTLESSQDTVTREQLAENINIAYLNSQARPREKYVSARTRESKYAAYIEKWRLLVERVGNLNYPEQAKRQKLKGALVLDVAISADGSISNIRILNSSGTKILDDAAERIVHIAAPFDRFPDSIRAEVDTLHIVRTWEFGQNKLKSSNVNL